MYQQYYNHNEQINQFDVQRAVQNDIENSHIINHNYYHSTVNNQNNLITEHNVKVNYPDSPPRSITPEININLDGLITFISSEIKVTFLPIFRILLITKVSRIINLKKFI